MPRYSFSTREDKAYYYNSIPGFINDDSDTVLNQLIKHSFEDNERQRDAWANQIGELQRRLDKCQMDGDIIFEYDIVRLGKRIDVILLIRHMVFSLEFKNTKNKEFIATDAQQAEDYATDIKNFHKESEDLYVCPILIVTDAKKPKNKRGIGHYKDKQIYLQCENIDTVIPKVEEISSIYGDEKKIDFHTWFNSPYYPTPTIIAAAVEAYRSHNLTEIANSEASQKSIEACENRIQSIIAFAKEGHKKCVCFITGVPGAGKTLVGLDVVTKNLARDDKDLSVYISGNGPLVKVLRKALKNSIVMRNNSLPKELRKRKEELDKERIGIDHLIESSLGFKKHYAKNPTHLPDHVLIFDEAQRVWNQQQMARKHKDDDVPEVSEPFFLYSIMDRHQDWAVMVCLVGLGQDIHDGEVGINEWFACGINDYKEWELFYSSRIFEQFEDKNINKEMIEACPRCHVIDELHLNVSARSFRANNQCSFVDYLIDNKPEEAKDVLNSLSEKYPIYITRDFARAKRWVRSKVRGSQRCGVLASSNAMRLKPEGIYVPKDIDVENWFLAPSDDIRSSNSMEIVASEFKVQGLEIDWSVVCWDADLRRSKNEWAYYSFVGTKWQSRRQPDSRRYLLNSYRVLLTRARQGMVIFVPKGVDPDEDSTRDHSFYDDIYDYLSRCGIKELKETYL